MAKFERTFSNRLAFLHQNQNNGFICRNIVTGAHRGHYEYIKDTRHKFVRCIKNENYMRSEKGEFISK